MAKRIKLSDEQRKKFERAAYLTYNNIATDAWPDGKTSKGEFVCVIEDQMHMQAREELSAEELELWSNLSTAERRRIVLAVGP